GAKDSHDVVPVIRIAGSLIGQLPMEARLTMRNLVGGLMSSTSSPSLAVDTSS
ncbi:MAG: hypothetical protein QOG46_95, partial [Pseudonocardiales bacterium]|nr:hypothetical protein [Pseudonocardiales bacterium]